MRIDPSLLHPELSANVVSFARLLRARGVALGPQEQRDALQALALVDLADLDAFRHALRTTLAKDPREHGIFDTVFEPFWVRLLTRNLKDPVETNVRERAPEPGRPQGPRSIKEWLAGPRTAQAEAAVAYSPDAVLSRMDFRHVTAAQMDEITRLILLLARPLAVRHSRRYRPTHRATHLDFRRAIRLNLRRGGDLLELAYHRPREERLDLVLLCDVSRSMDLYSRFLIPFIYAFQNLFRQIETFVFSTGLHRITDLLKRGDLPDVLDLLRTQVPDWGGGTRIGHALQTFLAGYGRLLHRRTVVLILSDGWDTGELDRLEAGMRTLKQRARRVLWLNPLMGHPDYEPATGGMKVALPYLDVLAPAHNVDSLREAVRHLVRLRP